MSPFAEGVATDAVFAAPENAVYAEIRLALEVRGIKKQPEVFIDQIEFAPTRR